MSAPVITPAQWHGLMHAIALDGVRVPLALKHLQIRPCIFRRLIDGAPELRTQFERAKKYAKRRRWPELVVTEVFETLARTNMSLKQVVMARGYSERDYRNFNAMCFKKPEWKEAYLAARGAQVTRRRTLFMDVPAGELVSRGKSWISREAFKVHSLRPMPERRAEAKVYRAERAASDPLYAARLRVKQGTKRRPA
jgi:hypothetical protein